MLLLTGLAVAVSSLDIAEEIVDDELDAIVVEGKFSLVCCRGDFLIFGPKYPLFAPCVSNGFRNATKGKRVGGS